MNFFICYLINSSHQIALYCIPQCIVRAYGSVSTVFSDKPLNRQLQANVPLFEFTQVELLIGLMWK